MKYWQKRELEAKTLIREKTEKECNKRLASYYANSMNHTIKEFESVYNKIQATIKEGKTPTAADLYKLDKYWQLQAELKNEATALGDKTVATLSKNFEKEWELVYDSIAIPGAKAFTKASTGAAKQAIMAVWCNDGKSFSDRVWNNTSALMNDLNDVLVHCVVTGKDTKELTDLLQERYNVSFHQARTLVRTETSHINNAAAVQRYKDYGITKIQVLADEAECDDCASEDGEIYDVDECPVPFHPNCTCAVIPYIED